MERTVRPARNSDFDALADVVSRVYNNGDSFDPSEWYGDCVLEDASGPDRFNSLFVGEVDGTVLGGFVSLPLCVTRGAAKLDCGGVAAVASAPEARRNGLGAAMMDWYVRRSKEEGRPLTALYAFRESFYRKSGYEAAGKRLALTVPSARIPKFRDTLPIRRLTPEDWPIFGPCHEAFAHARSGCSIRDARLWKRKLAESKPLAIYAAGDPVEAYAAIRHETAFWAEQGISELNWCTLRGYQSILAFLAGVGENKTALRWHETSDSPFLSLYVDQGVQVGIERLAMFRVCDVPGALRQLRPSARGEFTIEIDDPVVPENRGPWRVAFSSEGVVVERSSTADLRLDIWRFAQAFLGEPSLADLVRIDAVEVRNAEGLQQALRLLEPLPVYLDEFF